jgi:hypothetical protein
MMNEGFYPTPMTVIDRMIAPLKHVIHNSNYLPFGQILEPSAGKGDILDHLQNHYHVQSSQMYAIEIEPELRMILTGKGYRVIDSDFLKFSDPLSVNLVIMNPPFSNGDEHLLKAWDILSTGHIVCLLNAETILNPHTARRKLLATLIESNGRFEIAGSLFESAERSTDVNVAIVWLEKKSERLGYFDEMTPGVESVILEKEFSPNELASSNVLQSLVDQYNAAAQCLVEQAAIESRYRFYTSSVTSTSDDERNAPKTLNDRLFDLKCAFWKYVFDKTKLGKVTTSNFQREFHEFQQQQRNMAFTLANVMTVLEMFMDNSRDIITRCIVDVFDKATRFHEKNVVYIEGWKTNKSWKIAPKIIMPWGIDYDKWGYWSFIWSSRSAPEFYNDLDKALCFISGVQFESITSVTDAIHARIDDINRNGVDYDSPFDSTHFIIRIYKKGTVHLIFKDADMLAQFNIRAAQGKNWVGAGY